MSAAATFPATTSASERPAVNPWLIAATVTLATFMELPRIVEQQAAFLGFLDCFWFLGCACLIGAPLVFLTRKVMHPASGGGGH